MGQLDLKPDYLRTRKLIVGGFHFISLRKIRTFPDLQHLFHSLEFLKLPGRLSSIVFISTFQVSDLVPGTGHMLDKLLLNWVNCMSGNPFANSQKVECKSWTWRWAGFSNASPPLCTLFPLSGDLVTLLSPIICLER